MIRINNVSIPLDYDANTLKKEAAKELRIDPKAIRRVSLFRRSVDARKKDQIRFTCTLDASLLMNEDAVLKKARNAAKAVPYRYEIPRWNGGARPVVVGFGPAGMFAALVLAQSGARPIVIERGRDVDRRTADVQRFWTDGILDETSNVQFGEGGAGTFSDGKLNTGTKDSRQRKVLEEFVAHGAPGEILWNAKPHIGTDNLRHVVKSIREEILSLGGSVLFETKLTGFVIRDSRIRGAVTERCSKQETIETDSVILAVGHSARDTFELLHRLGLPMEAKPFSVGARIEHLRERIDRAQYGSLAGHEALGAAPYKLNVTTANGRGAYTFCMCPGGRVVNASSESGRLCTNGMSAFARDGVNSNAALLVSVSPADYKDDSPLGGMALQRELEEKAFRLGGGGYSAPVQRSEDFLQNRRSTRLGEVIPSVGPSYTLCNLHDILPASIGDSMREAITAMGRRLRGFDDGDAVLTGVETRSSSPVRILRGADTLQSLSVSGLFPCGEGAGYAGGIISAAVDGIKCAEKIITPPSAGNP